MKPTLKIEHQCQWCGHDSRTGEHGVLTERADRLEVFCTIRVDCFYSARIHKIPEAQ